MALPSYTETRYRIWHYVYLAICAFVFFFLIAPLFVIFPLSFNAEEFLVFSEGMKNLDPDAFSLRWYHDMVYGTKNPWGLAAKNSFIIAIFATIGSIILGTLAALGLSSRHMPYKGIIMATLIFSNDCSIDYLRSSNLFLYGQSWFSCYSYWNSIGTYNFRHTFCCHYSNSNIIWF